MKEPKPAVPPPPPSSSSSSSSCPPPFPAASDKGKGPAPLSLFDFLLPDVSEGGALLHDPQFGDSLVSHSVGESSLGPSDPSQNQMIGRASLEEEVDIADFQVLANREMNERETIPPVQYAQQSRAGHTTSADLPTPAMPPHNGVSAADYFDFFPSSAPPAPEPHIPSFSLPQQSSSSSSSSSFSRSQSTIPSSSNSARAPYSSSSSTPPPAGGSMSARPVSTSMVPPNFSSSSGASNSSASMYNASTPSMQPPLSLEQPPVAFPPSSSSSSSSFSSVSVSSAESAPPAPQRSRSSTVAPASGSRFSLRGIFGRK
jgi:hypothetical protein